MGVSENWVLNIAVTAFPVLSLHALCAYVCLCIFLMTEWLFLACHNITLTTKHAEFYQYSLLSPYDKAW